MDWRDTDDPYRIWVSEVMLQQTPVRTVAPYYRRFLSMFPTVGALADAPLDRVLKLWEGLGYYSRARNLHKAARVVVEEHDGYLPASVDALVALPGIGSSTAGAIAAIAFRQDAPILDSNAKRVLARLLAVEGDLGRRDAERILWEESRGLILPGKGRETALALMDLGATVCTPRKPRCSACPLSAWCEGYRQGIQDAIPHKPRKKALPRHETVAAVIEDRNGNVLIVRRPDAGLLGGLWEFPGGRRSPDESEEEALDRAVRENLALGVEILGKIGAVAHGYSHFRVTLHAYRCRKIRGRIRSAREWRWVSPTEMETYAFPGVNRKLMDRIAVPPRKRAKAC
ncbi:MAG: A/G-specific adenine glycosylase [Deltaproteobacteria bacterium]|nr:A/G-specific adenine glycosylase [Deltaproteobacteria bacterium]